MLVFHFLPHEIECPSLSDEANKNKTFSVIAKKIERGTPFRRNSLENTTKFYKECIAH